MNARQENRLNRLNTTYSPSIAQQRGITFVSLLLFLGAFAFIAIIAMKVVPIYLLNMNIVSAIEGLKKEPNAAALPAQQIQQMISKRFDINAIENTKVYINGVEKPLRANEIKVRTQGNTKILELNYEDRRHLFYNLSVVADFQIEVILTP